MSADDLRVAVFGSPGPKVDCNEKWWCKWGIGGGAAIACGMNGAALGPGAAVAAAELCMNGAMMAISSCDVSKQTFISTESCGQKFIESAVENPEDLIPLPGGGAGKGVAAPLRCGQLRARTVVVVPSSW